MFFIGIDIKSRGRYYQREGKIVQKAISFPNSCTGCNKLLVRAHQFTIHRNQLVFGMESTSHYWLALYTRLMKEDYQVHVINPIQSNALRGLFIRQDKTDTHDAFPIAELIRFGKHSETKVPQERRLPYGSFAGIVSTW